MKNKNHSKEDEDDPPSQASLGMEHPPVLEERWQELIEAHWEVLLFWLKAWEIKQHPEKRIHAPHLLVKFAMDLQARTEDDEPKAHPLPLSSLLAELEAYLNYCNN